MLRRAANALLWWALPGRCRLCDAPSGRRLDLCRHCEAALPSLEAACRRCATIAAALTDDGQCGACTAHPPPFTRTVCAFRYAAPVSNMILGLKKSGSMVDARLLAALLAHRVARVYCKECKEPQESRETDASAEAADSLPDALVPVPLFWRRQFLRGHNQAALLAVALGRTLELPVRHDLVIRRRHTPPQRGLGRKARLRNLAGAFEARARPPGHVALIDDVVTTTATGRALGRCLLAAGARRVDLWAPARTVTGEAGVEAGISPDRESEGTETPMAVRRAQQETAQP